jgi:hypothetical protein
VTSGCTRAIGATYYVKTPPGTVGLDGKNNRDYHISGRFQVNGYGLLVGKEDYLVWTTYENNSKATESNAIMAGGI